jgi:hypothetical protein
VGVLPFVKDRITLLAFDEDGILQEALEAEATLSANHKRHAQVTRHPVARGEALTDNVRPDPNGLTLDLFWGNRAADPILFGARYARGQFNAAEEAYEKLNAFFTKAYHITINMRLWTYENLVIEDMSVAETVEDGNSVKVSVQFTEIKTATASTISKQQVKPRRTGLGEKKPAGTKPQATANTTEKGSTASKLFDSTSFKNNGLLGKKP